MAGLTPLFRMATVKKVVESFKSQANEKTHQMLLYLGEEFVDKARLSGNYTDRTGNLRASIGYIILKDGSIISKNFQGGDVGRSKGVQVANEVAGKHPKGFVLIGVAGMEYAAAVEANNYDVITGSAPTVNDFKSILNEV